MVLDAAKATMALTDGLCSVLSVTRRIGGGSRSARACGISPYANRRRSNQANVHRTLSALTELTRLASSIVAATVELKFQRGFDFGIVSEQELKTSQEGMRHFL
jgi:hypothetical protein